MDKRSVEYSAESSNNMKEASPQKQKRNTEEKVDGFCRVKVDNFE